MCMKWLSNIIRNRQENLEEEIERTMPEIKKEIKIMNYEEKDGKIIYRCDHGKLNYNQRNNEFKWSHKANPKLTMDGNSMCNVTSIVMALDYAGYQFPEGRFSQPEDNLCEFIFTDPRVDEYYAKINPVMYKQYNRGDTDAYCPNLIHVINVYAANLWLGTSALSFTETRTIDSILEQIKLNRPVILSGTYPYTYLSGAKGTLGHINVIAGAIWQNGHIDSNPEAFIIDDPYGDYRDNFRSTSTRNDIIMPYPDFIRLQKPLTNPNIKWAYFVKPGAALI